MQSVEWTVAQHFLYDNHIFIVFIFRMCYFLYVCKVCYFFPEKHRI